MDLREACREGIGRALLAAGALIGMVSEPTWAQERGLPVDLELVVAIDTSGSVSTGEFELQVRGIANAFRDPEVIAAIEATGVGIAVMAVQWANHRQQVVTVDWLHIEDAASADRFAARVEATGRMVVGETAIGSIIDFATAAIESNNFKGMRRVIDISGDGRSNSGRDPALARDAADAIGITINGLAILNEVPRLDRYYADRVIAGPGSFLMIAGNYRDFAEAIRNKLLREISGSILASDEPPAVSAGTWRSVGDLPSVAFDG